MIHSHAIRHVAAFVYLGLIALAVACSSSDDDEKANPSTGGTGGNDAGGSGGTAGSGGSGGSGATDGGDASCTFGEPQVKNCNLTDNDCPCGAKCSLILTSENPYMLERACVVLKGAKVRGEKCTAEKAGIDDCGPSLMCLKTGPDGIPKCDGMCEKTSHCAGDEFCIDSMPEFQNPNKVLSGVCMAKCDPFNVAADCDPGQECDAIPAVEGTLIPACLQAMGASPEGTPCASFPFQCSPGLTCSKASWESDVHCRAFCDKAHACPSGRACTASTGGDFMVCLPAAPDGGTDSGTDAASDAGTDAAADASLD